MLSLLCQIETNAIFEWRKVRILVHLQLPSRKNEDEIVQVAERPEAGGEEGVIDRVSSPQSCCRLLFFACSIHHCSVCTAKWSLQMCTSSQ